MYIYMYTFVYIYKYICVYIYTGRRPHGGGTPVSSHTFRILSWYSLSSTTVNARVPVVNQEWVCVGSPSWLRQFVTILIPSPEDWSGVPVSVFKYMCKYTRMYTCMCKIKYASIHELIYAYKHVYMRVCIHVHIYYYVLSCMYIYMYIHTRMSMSRTNR